VTLSFFDSHAHLDVSDFDDDRDACLARARAAGVDDIVLIGATGDLSAAERAVDLAQTDARLYATVGVHPHDVATMRPDWWDALDALVARPKVVGVGETGLDYYYDHSPQELQREAFARFIQFARRHDKPVVCHVRDAHADARAILAAHWVGSPRGAVIHCFTGTPEDAAAYVELGCHVSFSGIVTFKGAKSEPIREAVHVVPHDRLLIETDCPYLAPQPFRGKRNEPAHMVHTAETVAREAGLSLAALAACTSDNARRFFGLD
jgi:TatD DNase family protein